MANICSVCGKGSLSGQNIRHPHSGAWATRAPRTKRQFHPNLQSVKTVCASSACWPRQAARVTLPALMHLVQARMCRVVPATTVLTD